MNQINLFQEKPLLADKIELTPTSLVIRGDMSEADYELAWGKLALVHGGTQWWIGDLYNAGEEQAKVYADRHGLKVKTVYEYAYVCRNISMRMETLSFQHHQIVVNMEPADQREWLEEAVRHTWTVAELRNAIRNAKPIPELPVGVFNVIYADPPWEYSNTGVHGAARHHYNTMKTTAIAEKLATATAAPNAVLFMWVTNPLLVDALFVLEETGWEYKTNIVWVKTELVKPGSGFYVRGRHELLFIATKGSFTPLDKNIAPPIGSIITSPVREHSRKPDEAVDIIERLYPGCSYLEMWGRTEREGWEVWGDEVGKY